ncbi:hypothetical protein [Dyadobacter jiangsuensis]|uniref:Uncharacterized protein n=1 Tax=Dyadobacter jiangsuensis TaxID=1591085 RepID=A0A2P8G0G2_9BACT|nr:hypothetical protein [Dyadobacter jiangsuensis]PSL27462.1 hypothetical protein CLV60_108320 [Dyadobacter jiangsuensis]
MENQVGASNPALAADVIEIKVNEFGILNSTQIVLDPAKAQLTFNKLGDSIEMNLKVTFEPQPGKIVIGPATVVADSLAAISLTVPATNFYKSGELNDLSLDIDEKDGVIISTMGGDLKLITSAPKKLSGQALKRQLKNNGLS